MARGGLVTVEAKDLTQPVFQGRWRALRSFAERHGFLIGLVFVTAATLADGTETTVRWGRWLKAHHGPDVVIAAIFFFSGLALKREALVRGLLDFKAFAGALLLIFGVSPSWALLLSRWPMETGLAVGLFLVASMPSTLSSGVVMTENAGGNPATALLVTIVANGAAVFATPFLLESLSAGAGGSAALAVNKEALMATLAVLVLVPLILGMALRRPVCAVFHSVKGPSPGTINTILVILVVWIAVCGSRATILQGLARMPAILILGVVFHGGVLLAAFFTAAALGLAPGRREALIFVGGQKTLPLSVLLQTAIFPQYGEALVFCVCHHVLHLIMDGCVLSFFKSPRRADPVGKGKGGR